MRSSMLNVMKIWTALLIDTATAVQATRLGACVIAMLLATTTVGNAATTTLLCAWSHGGSYNYGDSITLVVDTDAQKITIVTSHGRKWGPQIGNFTPDTIEWDVNIGCAYVDCTFHQALNRVSSNLNVGNSNDPLNPNREGWYTCKKAAPQF